MSDEVTPSSRGSRSIHRILDAAARMFGRDGYSGASMGAVARAAGVSKGLLHYHFQSKEHLLIEAVRATFRQLHRRFDDRFRRGERGLPTTLEALDSLWDAVRDMSAWAPFMVETISLATQNAPVREDLLAFWKESSELLEKGIGEAFPGGPGAEPLLPPDRLALIVRVALHGLVIELAFAQTEEERARVQLAYRDLRELFERVAKTAVPERP
jgi:AcrR family transcriptional regulator